MKTIYLIILLFLTQLAYSQSLVSIAGQSFSNTNYSLDWSLGEVIIDTYTNQEYIITQGFHQTKLTVVGLNEKYCEGNDFNVFPNPVDESLTINCLRKETAFSWFLFDETGKSIDLKEQINFQQNIDFQQFNPGIYILKIISENKTFQFKIVKP